MSISTADCLAKASERLKLLIVCPDSSTQPEVVGLWRKEGTHLEATQFVNFNS